MEGGEAERCKSYSDEKGRRRRGRSQLVGWLCLHHSKGAVERRKRKGGLFLEDGIWHRPPLLLFCAPMGLSVLPSRETPLHLFNYLQMGSSSSSSSSLPPLLVEYP